MAKITVEDLKNIRDKFEYIVSLREGIYKKAPPGMKDFKKHLMVCGGTGCHSAGAKAVIEKLNEELKKRNLQDEVMVVETGCNGFCAKGPLMVVYPEGIFYQLLTPDDMPEIIEEHILKGKTIERLMYNDPVTGEIIPKQMDIPFFKLQTQVVLRFRGKIDPFSIDDYIAHNGYVGLSKALTMKPEDVIDEVSSSGLRGRGGAGFPTGRKWAFARGAKGDQKYIIGNCDEGDPGAYMNRTEMETDPFSALEGMTIAAYAIGATQGFIYMRAEYPLAIERTLNAIEKAREYGLLGKDIFESGFDFDVRISRGAGAFVCGEETALISSIQGKLPNPYPRPPYPAISGLFGKPTVINNVETLTNVARIFERENGAKWFSSIGSETTKGTKVFSVVGHLNNTGLVEVPMGTTLREIVYDIGGGIIGGKKFKAIQTGGPSGGMIPVQQLDTPMDFEHLEALGSIMGSGGLIVVDENTCMIDLVKYFFDFLKEESCGKCTPCREGIKQALYMLEKICNGEGKERDIDTLNELAQMVKDFSLCALGGTAPNPLLTAIKYFKDEYVQHVKYKRCPAGVCKGIAYAPCQHTCSLSQDAPSYTAYIARGEFDKAAEVILRDNPFPSILGRVCHHPCEVRCRSGEGGEPIAIRALKRFAVENAKYPPLQIPQKDGNKVAVIGSGPGGLAAAYYLAQKGYDITIFEALPFAGGMMKTGIPEYRLPREILDAEIDRVKSLGVTIKTKTTIGKDITIDDLFKQDFKSVFVSTGAHKNVEMGIPGEDAGGVIDAIEFLRNVNTGKEVSIGKNVVVVGGGNAAIDAARVAWRLSKNSDVQIIYRRSRLEMPAISDEVDEALSEGIKIQFLAVPVRAITKGKKVESIECVRMRLGKIDASGRPRPIPIEGSEFTVPVDTLIPAIGQQPDLTFLEGTDGLEVEKNGTLKVDPDTLATSREGVFAGGDVVSGPATVVEAIGAAKVAVESIDRYINGKSLEREYKVSFPTENVEPLKFSPEEMEALAKQPRVTIPHLSIEERRGDFLEVESTISKEDAMAEAKRCLRCDLREEEE
jgi:NADH-quinone oxidoreductase subunit F